MKHKNRERLIIAHRGYRARYPENTMSAFKAAVKLGVPMIELDVTLTRDGQIVVIHDETLERTTNGSGLVRDHSRAELAELDAGAWFSPHFKGERIPTLDQVLDRFGNKTEINIEIKPEAFEQHDHPGTIERLVLSSVLRFSKPESVIISSFHPTLVERLAHQSIDGLRVAYLTEHEKLNDAMLDFMIRNRVYSWNPDYPVLTPDQITRVHDHGIRVYTYTVNRATLGRKCFIMGADGVFTDEPRLFGY